MKLEGGTAFVTGGSSGIGLGIVAALLDANMKVAFTYRDEAHRDAALAQLDVRPDQVLALDVDVTDRAAMANAATETHRRFGNIHVLVNNAGVYLPAGLTDTTYEDSDWEISINLTGVFNGIRTFVPQMLEHKEPGHIVATSSVFGLYGSRGAGAYAASKFGVVGLMEALRAELADTSLSASVFCPGTVDTDVFDWRRSRPEGRAGVVTGGRDLDPGIWRNPAVAISPAEAGRCVREGIERDDIFILSHAEYAGVVEARGAALSAAFAREDVSTPAREALGRAAADGSIYSLLR